MSAGSSPGLCSPGPLQLLVNCMARLAGADAIGVLATLPLAPLGHLQLVPLASYGDLHIAAVASVGELLDGSVRSGQMMTLSAGMSRTLAGASPPCFFATPILEEKNGSVLGAVIVGFKGAPADPQKAQDALDGLVHLAAYEMGQRRIQGDLTEALTLAKKLSMRHVLRREQERQNLASEIHDDLSQNVTYLRLALTSMQRQLEGGRLERARSEMGDLVTTSSQVKDSIQKLSSGLRPALIEILGPVPAIRQEGKLHSTATGVPVNCELQEMSMPAAVSLAGFRIVQESLSNIARHASASAVQIRLNLNAGRFVFLIEDDGCGFQPAEFRHSLGLLSMIERAEIAGGTLTINSAPGQGTRVSASFPVSPVNSPEMEGIA